MALPLAASYQYPLLDAFLTMLWFFLWILWIFLLIRILTDVFTSPDMSGWGKAGWTIFVIFLPFLGVFVYLIARGGKMANREMENVQKQQEEFKQYVQTTAGTSASPAEELQKLADLRDKGVLTQAEFEARKAKVLATD
jgi:hypothetical protein